jgi:hypothetical protein
MAPKGSPTEAALERFGREVIVQARDDTLSSHDAGLKYAKRPVQPTAAPEVKQRAADYAILASLSPEIRDMVRRMVVRATDSALFYTLKYLDDLEPQLIVDDQEVLKCVWGEIHGLPLTDEGWFAKYSKYGERGDAAVP